MAEEKKKGAVKSFIGEFREFIARGNVLDMAVGVVVGGAFTAIVNALVENILMPFIGMILAGVNFANLVVTIPWGNKPVINFSRAKLSPFLVLFNNSLFSASFKTGSCEVLTPQISTFELYCKKIPPKVVLAIGRIFIYCF